MSTFAPQPTAKIAIKGTVTGPDVNAVANAPVWAYTFSDSWVGSLATATDANGSYASCLATRSWDEPIPFADVGHTLARTFHRVYGGGLLSDVAIGYGPLSGSQPARPDR